MSLKQLVWRFTPTLSHIWLRNIFFTFRLLPNALYDNFRFLRYSGINRSRNYQGEQAARLTMAYHQLEKGLSFGEPRAGFGKDVVARLLTATENYISNYGAIPPATTALGVLQRYMEFNQKAGIDVSAIRARVDKMCASLPVPESDEIEGGTIDVLRSDLEIQRNSGFKNFFNSRYSIRNFSGLPIPEADIIEAIKIAQKTPSVCNRQAWKVHVYTKSEDMQRLMKIQSGSRGFGEQASALLVVTCDTTRFVEVAERYQGWIDGGMFSMSVCLAFHSLGYGSCCLNWSKEKDDDLALRQAASLPPHEQIIMLIAVGTLPESFRVAYSARRPLVDALEIH